MVAGKFVAHGWDSNMPALEAPAGDTGNMRETAGTAAYGKLRAGPETEDMVVTNNPPGAGTAFRHPKAVVWDLDGTLIDSLRDIASALNTLLAEQGLGPLGLTNIRSMVGDGSAKLIERGLAACGHPISEAESAALMTRFLPIYAEHATDTTRLYPGAVEALRDFASAGVRQGICTNKPEAISRRVLADLGVADYFELVIGGDSLAQGDRQPDRRL